MKFIYHYIYYKIYRFSERVVPLMVFADAETEAVFYFTLLFGIDLLCLGLYNGWSGWMMGILLLFHLFNSSYFASRSTEIAYQIKADTSPERPLKKITGEIAFWLFIVFSALCIFFITLYTLKVR